jgi:uncharacterized protein (TIGR04255 family)
MQASRRTSNSTRLPSAPLAEVVFELRWALPPAPPPFMSYDPMLVPLTQAFSAEMKRRGFPHGVDLSHPQQTGPYGVARRFFQRAEAPFPIMQIGSGIFASNQSVQYDWKSFKAQIFRGVRALLNSYPTRYGARLRPIYLELRYVDLFGKSVLGSTEFVRFMATGTSLNFQLPKMLESKSIFWGDAEGRFKFQRALRGRKNSLFIVDIGSGSTADTKQDVIRLESKVTSSEPGVPVLKNHRMFLMELNEWLEFAHSVTSPFFKEFILPDVMRKFGQKNAKTN